MRAHNRMIFQFKIFQEIKKLKEYIEKKHGDYIGKLFKFI